MESTAVLPWGGPSLRGEIWPPVRKHRIRGALAGARSVEELPLSNFFFDGVVYCEGDETCAVYRCPLL